MKIYTCTISRIEEAEDLGIYAHDITIKSGDKKFAPTWELLMRYKEVKCPSHQYTAEYLELMRESYRQDPEYWVSFCKMEVSIAVSCYYPVGRFCHRYLFVEIIKKVCKKHKIPFKYIGEL